MLTLASPLMFSHLGRDSNNNIADCQLPIANCRLPIGNRKSEIGNRKSAMSLLPKLANRAAAEIDPDALHLRVKVQRVPAHLAAVARLFISTKGRRCIEHVESIDPNNTRLNLFRETMRARDVPGPDP